MGNPFPLLSSLYARFFREGALSTDEVVTEPKFPQLIRERFQFNSQDQIGDPTMRMWVEFALSTNERGRAVADELEQYAAIRGKRCLDVGCAYGGFLVAFALKGASRVVGIDIDAGLLRLAAANLKDFHVSASLHQRDLLDRRVLRLGRFDVITCNDVIEHVEEPGKAIRHLSLLLKDGGVLYMQIPNRYFVGFIKEDGHYKLPGITLLPRQRAARYHWLNFGDGYGVGYYRKLDYYFRHLARQGLSPLLINQDSGISVPEQLEEMFRETLRTLPSFGGKRVEPSLAEEICGKATKIHGIFTREVQAFRALERQDPEQAAGLARRIRSRYGLDFWTVIAFKGTGRKWH